MIKSPPANLSNSANCSLAFRHNSASISLPTTSFLELNAPTSIPPPLPLPPFPPPPPPSVLFPSAGEPPIPGAGISACSSNSICRRRRIVMDDSSEWYVIECCAKLCPAVLEADVSELNARDAAERRAEMSLSILFSSRICVKVFAEEGEAGGGASAVDIVDELVRSAGGKS